MSDDPRVPAYFPSTTTELDAWRRNKTTRTLNDEFDQLHSQVVLIDEYYRALSVAWRKQDAVFGSLEDDDRFATKHLWDLVKQDPDLAKAFPKIAELQLKQFVEALHSLRVAKRRAGMSREDMKVRAQRAGGAA